MPPLSCFPRDQGPSVNPSERADPRLVAAFAEHGQRRYPTRLSWAWRHKPSRSLSPGISSDVIEGLISPGVCNAACNAGGKLLEVVETQHKYGSSKSQRESSYLRPRTPGQGPATDGPTPRRRGRSMSRRTKAQIDQTPAAGSLNSNGRNVEVELVYVDRPWPTPESAAAMRRFLERYIGADPSTDRPDLQPSEQPERQA
jgi:hypothetical protein